MNTVIIFSFLVWVLALSASILLNMKYPESCDKRFEKLVATLIGMSIPMIYVVLSIINLKY